MNKKTLCFVLASLINSHVVADDNDVASQNVQHRLKQRLQGCQLSDIDERLRVNEAVIEFWGGYIEAVNERLKEVEKRLQELKR
jgi:hypothetical protein